MLNETEDVDTPLYESAMDALSLSYLALYVAERAAALHDALMAADAAVEEATP